MDQVQGQVSFDLTQDGAFAMSVDGAPLATIGEPEASGGEDHLTVYLGDGERWMVKGIVPPMLAAALEAETAPSPTAVSPFGVPAWPSQVTKGSETLASAEIGVSPMTFAPVTGTIHSGDAAYTLTAGPSWRSWSLTEGEGILAAVDTTDGIGVRVHRPLPLPVLILTSAIVLGVVGETHRPTFMTAKRREGKAEDKFLKKYAGDIDAARTAGHDVQYMSAWDQRNDLYSWIECLTCGDRASTFGDLGGSMTTSLFYGKALGKLKGPLLEEPCLGQRKI